jgi:hypothetical protein
MMKRAWHCDRTDSRITDPRDGLPACRSGFSFGRKAMRRAGRRMRIRENGTMDLTPHSRSLSHLARTHHGSMYGGHEFPVLGLAFSHFLEQSRYLRAVSIVSLLRLGTCHCRAIDALARTDLKIELVHCVPSDSGEEILLECIRQNRGPTNFFACQIDTRRLADALRGNSSVTTLALDEDCSVEEKLVLIQALAENVGLVTLDLHNWHISDETWITLWQSVARHPKHENIILPQENSIRTWTDGTSDAQKTLRMQAMVDALRISNTVLHTIELNRDNFDKEILDSTVYPLLKANRYRPRVRAIAKQEGPWRRKLLGRALAAISSDPALISMFLMDNANVRLGRIPLKRKRAPDSDKVEP